jgi:probable rRNA maturation factor
LKKISILSDDAGARLPLEKKFLKTYITSVLQECGVHEYTINIVFINDVFMLELNTSYRNCPRTTDVLSFTLSDENAPALEGEIYLSRDQTAHQSTEMNVPLEEETIRLITHGILHLTGRTHETDEKYQAYIDETERLMRLYGEHGEIT